MGSAKSTEATFVDQTDVLKFFGRHFVSMGWMDRSGPHAKKNEGKGENFSTSGFIVSAGNVWFLITAGHILDGIEKAREAGQIISHFRLDDGWNAAAKHPPMPFDFDNADKLHYFDESIGADYAAIRLTENTRALLAANGVEALDKWAWKLGIPETCDLYYVVGIPSQFTKTYSLPNALHITNALALISVNKLAAPPEDLATPVSRFYGRVAQGLQDTEGTVLTNLDGMSGSPIFGFQRETRRYWVLAIQSGVNESQTVITACPFLPLGVFIEESLKE